MATYQVGDRVNHETCGFGTVTEVVAGIVHVTYDRVGRNGKPWRGIYPESWFRICGHLLERADLPKPTST